MDITSYVECSIHHDPVKCIVLCFINAHIDLLVGIPEWCKDSSLAGMRRWASLPSTRASGSGSWKKNKWGLEGTGMGEFSPALPSAASISGPSVLPADLVQRACGRQPLRIFQGVELIKGKGLRFSEAWFGTASAMTSKKSKGNILWFDGDELRENPKNPKYNRLWLRASVNWYTIDKGKLY